MYVIYDFSYRLWWTHFDLLVFDNTVLEDIEKLNLYHYRLKRLIGLLVHGSLILGFCIFGAL